MLKRPDTIFGVHSISFINKSTGLPYGASTAGNGIIKLLKTASIMDNQDLVGLSGGSYSTDVVTESGKSEISIDAKLSEYPGYIFDLMGLTRTRNNAEASGAATEFANKIGSSVKHATTGVASISITTAADKKYGHYLVKAASSTTVNVYGITDIDFKGNGTILDYVDESLKITASALTITAATLVEIPGTGISLTGGSGTIGMTSGDVAVFEVRKANTGSEVITRYDSVAPVEFEAYFYSQRQASGDRQAIRAYRCVMSTSMPGFAEKAFSEIPLKIRCLPDTAQGGKVYDFMRVFAA
jgi:hypothetical protein